MAKKRRRVFTISPSRRKGSGVIASPVTGDVGIRRGNTSVGYNVYDNRLGASSGGTSVGYEVGSGNVGAGQSRSIGGGRTASVSAGYNPETGNIGYGAGVSQGINSGNVSANVGVGIGTAGPTGGARIQVGKGEGNATGANVGAAGGAVVGTIFGGPLGGMAGSAVGSAAGSIAGGAFNPSQKTQDHKLRNAFRSSLERNGFLDAGGTLTLPDGTVANLNQEGEQGTHGWRDPAKRVEAHQGRDTLFAYDTDYTNDLDYVANMAGNTLTRALAGGAGTSVDQVGAQLGNQLLGKVGFGADMTQENFMAVMRNARAAYAKAGIGTKEDLLALSNQAFAEGRINDFDHAAANQTASLVFDNDFTAAQQLMNGRHEGVRAATQTPSASGRNEVSSWQRSDGIQPGQTPDANGMIQAPVLTANEAIASVQPFVDYYRSMLYGEMGMDGEGDYSPSVGQRIQQGAGLIRAGANAVGAVRDMYNTITGSKRPPSPGGLGLPLDEMNYSQSGANFNYGDSSTYDTTGTGAGSGYQLGTDVTSEYGSGGSAWDRGSDIIDGLTTSDF